MSNPVGRPKDIERNLAGRYTYTRLGEKLICFPSEAILKDELELIKAINTGYDKGITTELNKEQHGRMKRLLDYHLVTLAIEI